MSIDDGRAILLFQLDNAYGGCAHANAERLHGLSKEKWRFIVLPMLLY